MAMASNLKLREDQHGVEEGQTPSTLGHNVAALFLALTVAKQQLEDVLLLCLLQLNTSALRTLRDGSYHLGDTFRGEECHTLAT